MIITVTLDPALERTVPVSALTPGAVCRAGASRLELCGQGFGVAAAVRALGGRCAALGVAGGAAGEYIRDRLDALDVPNDLVFVPSESRVELCLEDGGTVTRIVGPGAALEGQALDQVWLKLEDLAEPGDVVLFSHPFPPGLPEGLPERWAAALRASGVHVVLEAEGGGEALARELIRLEGIGA